MCEVVSGDEDAELLSVGWLGFGADDEETGVGCGGEEAGEGFEERELIFLGVDAADGDEEEGVGGDIVGEAEGGAVA